MRSIILSLAVLGALGLALPVVPASAEGVSVNIGDHDGGRHHHRHHKIVRHHDDHHHDHG
jgi:hypothetical protein